MQPEQAYEKLIKRSREHSLLGSCSALLNWDENTYMPSGGAGHRANQMGLLAGLHHERATDPKIGELLAMVEGSGLVTDADSPAAVNVRELRRSYDRRTRLPRALVEELAHTTSLAQPEWVSSRAASDFSRFRPWLEKLVALKRDEAACLAVVGASMAPLTIPCSTNMSPEPTVPSWPSFSRHWSASSSLWSRPSVKQPGTRPSRVAGRGPSSNVSGEAILKRLYPRPPEGLWRGGGGRGGIRL